ncbi:MAG: hypothetical protein ACFE75_06975 [Candidatus Hodarchaeota archaeon]
MKRKYKLMVFLAIILIISGFTSITLPNFSNIMNFSAVSNPKTSATDYAIIRPDGDVYSGSWSKEGFTYYYENVDDNVIQPADGDEYEVYTNIDLTSIKFSLQSHAEIVKSYTVWVRTRTTDTIGSLDTFIDYKYGGGDTYIGQIQVWFSEGEIWDSIQVNNVNKECNDWDLRFRSVAINPKYIWIDVVYIKIEYYIDEPPSPITIISPQETTYTHGIDGYYLGTYGFENDEDGSNPSGWTCTQTGGWIDVIAEKGGHKKVVQFYKHTYADYCQMKQEIEPRSNGTIEFWWRVSSPNKKTYFIVYEGTKKLVSLNLVYDSESQPRLQYHDGGWIFGFTYSANTWYRFSVSINMDSDRYGFSVYDDDGNIMQIESDLKFYAQNTGENFNIITFACDKYTTGWYTYVDAIGYSWDSYYTIGENFLEGLLLDFNAEEFGTMSYKLTSGPEIPILGDTVIPFPDSGTHNLTVYADEFSSDPREFTINNQINVISPESITYTSPMEGYYPATYGFEDDTIGATGTAISFIDYSNYGTKFTVIDEFNGHKNVLRVESYGYDALHYFKSGITSGSMEYWFAGWTEKRYLQYLRVDTGNAIKFRCDSIGAGEDRFQYFNGIDWVDLAEASDYEWFHIKFDFDCDTDKFNIWIDGIIVASDIDFLTPGTEIANFYIEPDEWTGGTYYGYFDAFGFSWDTDYNTKENRYEGLLLNVTSEVDLGWMAFTYDGGALTTFNERKVIPFYDRGSHSIRIFGKDLAGVSYYSELLSYECSHEYAEGFLYAQSSIWNTWEIGVLEDDDAAIISIENPGEYFVIYTATYKVTDPLCCVPSGGGWVQFKTDEGELEETRRLYECLNTIILDVIYGTIVVADVVTLSYGGVKAQISFTPGLNDRITLMDRSICAIPLVEGYEYISTTNYREFDNPELDRTVYYQDPDIHFEGLSGEFFAVYTASFMVSDPTMDFYGVHSNGDAVFVNSTDNYGYTRRVWEFPAHLWDLEMVGTILLADRLELNNNNLYVNLSYSPRDGYGAPGDEMMTLMERSMILIPLIYYFDYVQNSTENTNYNQDIGFENVKFECFVMYTARCRFLDPDRNQEDQAIGFEWSAFNNGIDTLEHTKRYNSYPEQYGTSFWKTIYLVEILDLFRQDIKVEYYWAPADNEILSLRERSMILIPFFQ